MRGWLVTALLFTNLAYGKSELSQRIQLADNYYQKNKFADIVRILNPYSEELSAYGLMLLASSYSRLNKFSEEVRILKTWVSKAENNFQPRVLLGQALLKQALQEKEEDKVRKLQVEAIKSFRESLKLRPTFKPAFDELLNVTLLQNANNESRELVIEGMQRYGRRPEYVSELCRLDALGGFVVQAIHSCEEAIHTSPQFPDSYVYLSQAFFDQTEKSKSERTIVTAAKRFPASEFVQWAAGKVFMEKKNYPVSARYFGQAVKNDAASDRALFGYAQSLFETGHVSEALPFYKQACKLAPQKIAEPFMTSASKLRLKNHPLAGEYRESAASCHH